MSARIPCCIPFCRRTFKDDGAGEVICGKHWRAIPAQLKARRRQLNRRARKVDRLLMRRSIRERPHPFPPACTGMYRPVHRARRLWLRCWEQCKAAAIEAAGGIG